MKWWIRIKKEREKGQDGGIQADIEEMESERGITRRPESTKKRDYILTKRDKVIK